MIKCRKNENLEKCKCRDKFLDKLFNTYEPIKDNLIQMLNEIQEHYGYVPMDVQKELSEFLNVPMAEIYGVITFYSRFTLKPKGKYSISVCLGTACYVKGAQKIMDRLQERLGISEGETTKDRKIFNRSAKVYRSMRISTSIYSKRKSIWKSNSKNA